MSQNSEAAGRFELLKSLRAARDSVGDDLAKVVISITGTHLYHRLNAAIARPTLLVTALLRAQREAAMSSLLAQLNMPSREEVLALSQRLTRIEMVLDDLGAGVDQLRRAVPSPRPQRPAASRESGADYGRQGPGPALSAKEA